MPIIKEELKSIREYMKQLNTMYERIEIDSRLHAFVANGWFEATGQVRINREKWLLKTDEEIRRTQLVIEAKYLGQEIIVEKKTVFSAFE